MKTITNRVCPFRPFSPSPFPPSVLAKAVRVTLVAIALAGALPLLTAAYGQATARRMAEVNLRLAPPSLRAALLAQRGDLERGLSEALRDYASSSAEELAAEAQREFAGIPGLPSVQAPFGQVAYHFGKLAGLIYIANDPFARSGDKRALEVHQDYLKYVERKLPLLVFSFDGYSSPPLEGDLGRYLSTRMTGEGRYTEAVLFCYYPSGTRVSSDTFDDRSNAFGAAQVILSHAVSDAAKAWLQVWKAMDGDLSSTPYLRRSEMKVAQKGK